MKEELTLDAIKVHMPKKYRGIVTQDIVDDINRLVDDPDYGEEFKEAMITHTSVLGDGRTSMKQYLNAVKYYSLTASSLSQVDAYIRVFPERLEARIARGQGKEDMRGEAARFNQSDTVNRVRQQALVPLHLINQGLLQQAINVQAKMMLTAKSEMVRQKASETLIRELKAPETAKIELDIGIKTTDSIADLRKATEEYVLAQHKSIVAGVAVKEIAESKIASSVIEAELDE